MSLTSRTFDDPFNAFCKDSDAYPQGAPDGDLSGLTFTAKDIFDVAGYVTGAEIPTGKQPTRLRPARSGEFRA